VNVQVFEAVADTLWQLGVRQVFGVAGSGNYRMTHALKARGAHYVSARHEGGAVSMADAFSRVADSIPVVSVHQGGGLTNTITGLTEAVKSHTQMIVLSGEAPLADRTSNFRIGQEQLVEAVNRLEAMARRRGCVAWPDHEAHLQACLPRGVEFAGHVGEKHA